MASPNTNPPPPDFLDAMRRLGRSLLALIRTRAELLAVEIDEQKERSKGMVLLAVLGALFLALGLQMLAILVVAVFWDTYRVPALVGVTAIYLCVAAAAFLRLQFMWRSNASPFAATLEELKKDLDAMQGSNE